MTKKALSNLIVSVVRILSTCYILILLSLSAQASDKYRVKDINQHHITMSPDAKTHMFHSQQKNLKGETETKLFIKKGENQAELFAPELFTHMQEARWSPDGKWIAFIGGSGYKDGQTALYIIQPDTTQLKKLFHSKTGLTKAPSWNPDSNQIVFDVRNKALNKSFIYKVDLQGNYSKLTTANQGILKQPEWSPNGNKIAAVHQKEAGSDLVIFSLNDVKILQTVTHSADTETMPIWHPNGSHLFFVRRMKENNQHDLFMLNLQTNIETRLTNSPLVHEFFPMPDTETDRLYFDKMEFNSNGMSSVITSISLMPETKRNAMAADKTSIK